jgi:WD40 repeat protein
MGNYIGTGGGDCLIKIWDLNKNCESKTIKAFSRPISAVSFTSDNEFILGCSVDRSIKLCKINPSRI